MRLAFLLLLSSSLITLAQPARAATVVVSPGPGTPLQDAIDGASPGDRLQLLEGDFPEAIVVDKQLKIFGQGPGLTRIGGDCSATTSVEIAADGVDLERVWIDGGTVNGLVSHGRSGIRLKGMTVRRACGATGVGVDIEDAPGLLLKGVTGSQFPIGVRLANFGLDAHARVYWGGGEGSTRAFLIENVQPGALRLKKCQALSPDTAIELRNADGVRILSSVLAGFGGGPTSRGIFVDGMSDENRFIGNQFQDFATDVVDDGFSNCWSRNYSASPPLTGNASAAGCHRG